MTQQELNKIWATHLSGSHSESFACKSTAKVEVVENVVSGRSWARVVGGEDWAEVKSSDTTPLGELLREF